MNAMEATAELQNPRHDAGAVLTAAGTENAYRRGPWPLRRSQQVLRRAHPTLHPGEVVGRASHDQTIATTAGVLRGRHGSPGRRLRDAARREPA